MKYLFIALGGAVGAVLRFSVSTLLYSQGGNFPWGTLAVNILGSFLLALFMGWSGSEHHTWNFFLAIGLLGAFTTFSTFSMETFLLFKMAKAWLAILNMLANMGLGLVVAIAGFYLGNALK
jgi:fluoride exporter